MGRLDREKIGFYYSIFLGVFTVVVGVLFLAEAADLYYSGVAALEATRGMYSRAEVGARLRDMLAPLILWILSIIVGAVIYILTPIKKKRTAPAPTAIYRRLRMRATEEKDPAVYASVVKAERIRLIVRCVAAAFSLLAAVMCIVYLATASHFTSLAELNANVLHMVANVFPWVGAAFAVLMLEAVFEGLFARRMLPQLKRIVGRTSTPSQWQTGTAKVSAFFDDTRTLLVLRIAVFAVAVVFIGLGIHNGGAQSVLIKAINICSECIGLG